MTPTIKDNDQNTSDKDSFEIRRDSNNSLIIILTPEQIEGLRKHKEKQLEGIERVKEKWKQKLIEKKLKRQRKS